MTSPPIQTGSTKSLLAPGNGNAAGAVYRGQVPANVPELLCAVELCQGRNRDVTSGSAVVCV